MNEYTDSTVGPLLRISVRKRYKKYLGRIKAAHARSLGDLQGGGGRGLPKGFRKDGNPSASE